MGRNHLSSFSLSGDMVGAQISQLLSCRAFLRICTSSPQVFPRQSGQTLSAPFSKVQHILLETMEKPSGDIITGGFAVVWLHDLEQVT